MPPGGDGFYYLSAYFIVFNDESAFFDIKINVETLCTAYADQTESPSDYGHTSCSATTFAVEGKITSKKLIVKCAK